MKCKICKREKIQRSWFWFEERFFPICLECELSFHTQFLDATKYEVEDFLDFRLSEVKG